MILKESKRNYTLDVFIDFGLRLVFLFLKLRTWYRITSRKPKPQNRYFPFRRGSSLKQVLQKEKHNFNFKYLIYLLKAGYYFTPCGAYNFVGQSGHYTLISVIILCC